MKSYHALAAAVLFLLPALAHAVPVTTSPGKTSVFASETAVLDGIGDIPVLSAQILKAKAHQVLRVDVTVIVDGSASLAGMYTRAFVNGIDMNPGPLSSTGQCNTASALRCSVTGTYWIDIDTAETQYPGLFVGLPLNIQIYGGNNASSGSGLPCVTSMSAQMVKK
jgi:hypothetical protein